MGKVEHIEQEIRKLSGEEFAELRDWLMDQDWRLWDAKFEADVHAGKLDALGEAARRAHAQGKTTRL